MNKKYVLTLAILLFLLALQITFFLVFEYSVFVPDPASASVLEDESRNELRETSSKSSQVALRFLDTLEQKIDHGVSSTSSTQTTQRAILRPEYKDDPEGPLLAEIQQLLRTVNLHAMLDVGCSMSGRMSQVFGSKFDRVVVIAHDSRLLNALKTNFSSSRAEFVHGDLVSFGEKSQDKFDVVFLNMVLQALPPDEVAPTLRALEALLNDEGIGIVSTTYVEEGHAGFWFGAGDIVETDEFSTPAYAPPGMSGLRRWTKSELIQQLRGSSWELTSHVTFTYHTDNYARLFLEQQDKFSNRSFEDFRSVPVSQMVAVRRLVTSYRSKFGEPLEPSSSSVTNVIFSLVRGASLYIDLEDFVASRKCLRAALHYNESWNGIGIDEVVFHEGNVLENVQSRVVKELPGLRFVDVRNYGAFGGLGNGSGGGIFRWKPWARLRRPHEYPVGYRHMCRFMAMVWVHALSKYDYAMRVDDDVCIHKMAHPFRFLRESHAVYAYGLATTEGHGETVETLTPWLHAYTKNRSITPNKPLNAERMYFTNFFVANVSWWRSDSIRVFMDTVDRSGNIYHHRWGDAPLQTAALDMFAAQDRVRFLRVDYSHLSTSNEILNGSEVLLFERTTTSHTTTRRNEFLPQGQRKFVDDWNTFIAPCAVANHFNLTGAPFKSHVLAFQALNKVLKPRAEAENINIAEYSPADIVYAVQVDIYGSQEPLPPESVQGSARRNAMFRVLTGQDRQHPEDKEFTVQEWARISAHPCFSLQNFLDRLNAQIKLAMQY